MIICLKLEKCKVTTLCTSVSTLCNSVKVLVFLLHRENPEKSQRITEEDLI
jgi:hypothetical protein